MTHSTCMSGKVHVQKLMGVEQESFDPRAPRKETSQMSQPKSLVLDTKPVDLGKMSAARSLNSNALSAVRLAWGVQVRDLTSASF